MSLKIWSHSPETWAMAAPTALAQSPCSTWITWDTPGSLSGIRKAPPPTAISGTSPASVFMRSIASSARRAASANTFRQVAASRWATLPLSPSFRTPLATAMSVVVSCLPPKAMPSFSSR